MTSRVRTTGSGQTRPLQSIVLWVAIPIMSDLLSRLLGIIALRLGPQDLPAGNLPLAVAVAGYCIVTAFSLSIGETPDRPMLIVILAVALPLVLVRIVLGLRGHPARSPQTLTALFGTSALLSILSLPVSSLTAAGETPPLAVLASLALFAWSFVVDAHIWRHALEVTFSTGLAVAVVLFALSLFVISSLAGPIS